MGFIKYSADIYSSIPMTSIQVHGWCPVTLKLSYFVN